MPPSRQIDKVDLFLSTEPNKFSYKGLCKVYIHLGPKLLVVKNDDADTRIIEIPFYYPFMMHQNILCHISPTKLHDIVLIFPTDKICNEIYNIVHNYQAKINHEAVEDSNKVVILSDRILNPLSLAISSDPNFNRSTKRRILQMVQPINSRENDKKIVIKSELSEHPSAVAISSTITINMPNADSDVLSPNSRKRKNQTQSSSAAAVITISPNKRCKTEVFDEDITPETSTITDTNTVLTKRFLNSTEYEIQTFFEKSTKKQKLIVYCSADKKLCYSYFYERKSKRFVCEKCKEQNRYVVAYLREQQNDSQFVELGLLPHLCNSIPYSQPPPTTFYVHGNTDSGNQSLPVTSAINGLDLIPSSSFTSSGNNTASTTSATFHRSKKAGTTLVRKISEVFKNVSKEGNSNTPDSSSTLNETPEILKPPQYEIHKFPNGKKHKQRLIVFYPCNQSYCFPYSYEVTNDRFICIRCKKNRRSVVAYVKYDSNGDEYLELGPLYHLCPPLSVENYPAPHNTNEEFNGSSNILPLEMSGINSDNLTPELDNNSFVAYNSAELKNINLLEESKAGDKDVKQEVFDEVLKDVKQEEIDQYLKSELSEDVPISLADQEVSNASSPETAELENDDDYSGSEEDAEESTAFEPKKILDSSQFEIQKFTKNGQQRLRLITFVPPNKKYGFFYYHDVNNKRYVCSKCRKQRHNVHAYLRENSNGESFLELGLRDHICKPVLYAKPVEKPKEIPLNPDQYVLTYSREGRLRPIIFASKDKKLCYEFSPNQRKIFICCGCANKADAASVNVVEEGNSFKISLRNAKHICKARKFLPDKNGEKILMTGKFKFYNDETNGIRELKLITFPYDDGNEKCYVYEYSKDDKFFHCINCQRDEEEGGEVIAKLFININGEEYIIDRIPKEHSCKPIIYTALDQTVMNFLTSSGLNVKKLHSKTWNENKIVKAGNFELQRNRFGILNALLLLFSSEDKKHCYRYYYDKFTKHYICNNCREKFKIKVTAKLYDDGEDGHQYLKLGSLEHQCSPIAYENERKILKKPNFIIFDSNNVIVFPTSSRDECYRYSSKKLRCNPCRMKNKDVSVIILNDQNGEECLQLSKIQHVCELQKLEDVAEKIGVEVEDIFAKAV